jgi:hypothetical protein
MRERHFPEEALATAARAADSRDSVTIGGGHHATGGVTG